MLLIAALLFVGTSAWADWTTLYSQDYENAETYTSGWTIANTTRLAFQHGDHGDGKCLWLKWQTVNNNNGTNATFTLGSSYTAYNTSENYKLEFDFAMTANNSSNLNFVLQDASGNEICTFYAPSYSSSAGALKNGRVRVGGTDVDESKKFTYEQKRGNEPTYWNHVTLTSNASDGTNVTIDDYDGTQITVKVSNEFKRFGKIVYYTNKSLGELKFDNMSISVYSDTEIVPNPTAAITGVNGTERTVTLTLGTGSADGTTMAYSTNADMTESTNYTDPFTVSTTGTIYFQSTSPTSAKSEIQSINVTCEAVKLNTPVISRSGNTITITQDQSDLDASPSATIYYTYGGGDPVEYSSAITVVADATITAYASYSGYTTSDNVSRAVAVFPTDVAKIINAPENKSYTTAALSGVDVAGTNTTFQALMIDEKQWGDENVYVAKENFCWRNDGGDWYINSQSNVWLLVKNCKVGDIIVANTDYQASGLTNATYTEKYSEGNNYAYTVTADGDVEIAFKKPTSKTMHYFRGLYVWSHSIPVEVSAAGYATYVPTCDLDFSATSIEAYKVKVSTKGVATLLKVDNVPAGTPVLLYKEGGATEDIPVMTGADAVTGNDLVAGTGAAVATVDGTYTNMILNNGSKGIGFYFAAGKTVAANRAYLHIATTLAPDAAGSRMSMVFDDEATGVDATLVNSEKVNSEVYDLQGRRVAQPTKGLYIVNGKKVIIK